MNWRTPRVDDLNSEFPWVLRLKEASRFCSLYHQENPPHSYGGDFKKSHLWTWPENLQDGSEIQPEPSPL